MVGAGEADYVVDVDFNGTARNGAADVGAYKFDQAGNPGWAIQAGFKQIDATSTGGGDAGGADAGTDAGPMDAGGSQADAGSFDAGSGGQGDAALSDGGAGDATSGAQSSSAKSDGCSCRTAGSPARAPMTASMLAFLALMGLGVRRRRRARP